MDDLINLSNGLDCQELIIQLAQNNAHLIDDLFIITKAFQNQLKKYAQSNINTSSSQYTSIKRPQASCTIHGQNFQQPRGLFSVDLSTDDDLVLVNKDGIVKYLIKRTDLKFCMELPVIQQSSRLLFALRNPISVGKSACSCILVTPKPSPKSKELHTKIGNESISEAPLVVWKKVFEYMKIPLIVEEPRDDVFKSSVGQAGLKCYYAVNDGFLFPIKQGLVFIQKPTIFMPREMIERVEVERKAAVGSRNFDIIVFMKSGETHEIRMLERSELGPIASYIDTMGFNKIKRVSDYGESGMSLDANRNGTVVDDFDESEDSDFSLDIVKNKSKNSENGSREGTDDECEFDNGSESESDRESDIDVDDINFSGEPMEAENSQIDKGSEDGTSSLILRMKNNRRGNCRLDFLQPAFRERLELDNADGRLTENQGLIAGSDCIESETESEDEQAVSEAKRVKTEE